MSPMANKEFMPMAVLVLLAFAGLAVVAADRRMPEEPPADLRYFHDRPGHASGLLNPSDAAVQVRGIAAARHVPLQEVRHLMDDHVEGHGLPLGRQQVRVHDLNEALDERWPIK